MNILWFGVIRPLYALGLLIAIPLSIVVAVGGVWREPDVAVPVLGACALYLALAVVVFGTIPARLKSRLMAHVAAGRPAGFAASFEATSVLHNRYLGIDRTRGQAYYVDTDSGTRTVVNLDCLEAWQLVAEPNKAPMLTITAGTARCPTFRLRLRPSDSARIATELSALTH